ncbi:hypothetical protein BV22DRAFT_606119 [Leucogyrophana mollusca]|uniref:Uncharacterized protein n=1 Tax=Leucogyrophana mollusca TaxID=85980 RepID=A0ACB8BCW7_9AGAM|nr:hypothetical protein BV22DRAFT_606119 [Leucogyrophana mollusca]
MLSNLAFSPGGRAGGVRSAGLEPKSPTTAVFIAVDDELRDARRVHSQGQEEDLRLALDRVIKRVEELSTLLKTAYKSQTELETSLNLAKSNLQLVISNNEMLEEALKREGPGSAKDVGWRRWSAREVQHMERTSEEDRPKSLDYGALNEQGVPSQPSTAAVVNGTKPPCPPSSPSPPAPVPLTASEGRFFKFRFNSGSKSPAIPLHASHLTSPSLPTLVSSVREKELEELQEQLERERKARKTAADEKIALEAELESLSQALFEEANKMVATERIKRAETEEELQEVRLEKDALREALRLIETENGRLRSANVSSGTLSDRTVSHSRSSSREALKSPLSVSEPSTPRSADRVDEPQPTSASSYLSETPDHLADFSLAPAPKPLFGSSQRKAQAADKSREAESTVVDNSPPLPSGFASPRPVPFISDEPSPWADAPSLHSPQQ